MRPDATQTFAARGELCRICCVAPSCVTAPQPAPPRSSDVVSEPDQVVVPEPAGGPLASPANWLDQDRHHWAFQHVEEFLPTHRVPCDPAAVQDLASAPADLAELPVPGSSRGDVTLADVLDSTATDAWLVMHDGVLVAEQYRGGHGTRHDAPADVGDQVGRRDGGGHPLRAGPPRDRGPGHPVRPRARERRISRRHRPQHPRHALGSAVPTRTTRIPTRMSAGWRPPSAGGPGIEGVAPGLHRFLSELEAAGPHGGPFDYRSCETDVLGWVCERASGAQMPDLISDLVWRPMGAEHDATLLCDALGASVHDGGLSGHCPRRGPVRPAPAGRRSRRGPSGRAARLVRRRLVGGPRRPLGLRGLPRRGRAARRLVPQPALGGPRAARRRHPLPGHLRSARPGRPGHANGDGEALLLALGAGPRPPLRHAARVRRRGRGALGPDGAPRPAVRPAPGRSIVTGRGPGGGPEGDVANATPPSANA